MTIPSPDRLRELRAELVEPTRSTFRGYVVLEPGETAELVTLLDSHLAGAGATPKCDHMGCAVNTHLGSPTGECTRCGETFALQTLSPTPPPAADKPTWTPEGIARVNHEAQVFAEAMAAPPQPASQALEIIELLREDQSASCDVAFGACGRCASCQRYERAISALSATPARGDPAITTEQIEACVEGSILCMSQADKAATPSARAYYQRKAKTLDAMAASHPLTAPPTQDAAGGAT